jgi:hypothetical protein
MNTKSESNTRSESSVKTGAVPSWDRGGWVVLQSRLERVDHSELEKWIDNHLSELEAAFPQFETEISVKKSVKHSLGR